MKNQNLLLQVKRTIGVNLIRIIHILVTFLGAKLKIQDQISLNKNRQLKVVIDFHSKHLIDTITLLLKRLKTKFSREDKTGYQEMVMLIFKVQPLTSMKQKLDQTTEAELHPI